MFILFQVPLINKNGTKSTHCIIRGKFVISPCRKSALFWIHAVILLFHAEILPCGPPLLPHSCAEPFLGVMQKYSFLGDICTSAPKLGLQESKSGQQNQRVPIHEGGYIDTRTFPFLILISCIGHQRVKSEKQEFSLPEFPALRQNLTETF